MLFGINRPPSTSILDFIVELSSLLTNLNNTTVIDNLIIAGDFNIDLLSNICPDFTTCCYLMYCLSFYFLSYSYYHKFKIINITFFVNCIYLWQNKVLDCNLSDHEMIFLSIDIPVPETQSYNHNGKLFSYKLFCKYISSTQFDFVDSISYVNESC